MILCGSHFFLYLN